MSEYIKITIVIDNDKTNTEFGSTDGQSVIVTHDSKMTIMSTLLKNNLISGSFCGGRGDCGRCRIQFVGGVTVPTALERSALSAEELRQGYRLACLARPKVDCVIRLALIDAPKTEIISEMMDVTENIDFLSQRNNSIKNRKSDVMESAGTVDSDTMIAVDLGTTTIAMQLMQMDTGKVIDTYCEMNPQRRYGSDVLSRIQASCEGNREILQKSVLEVLERGVARFGNRSSDIKCMCIAGNTTMEHLLKGYDVSSLGRSPFTPVEIGLQEYTHPAWDFPVWLMPGISTFVGGDIVAGLYACGMLNETLREQCAGQQEYGQPAGQQEQGYAGRADISLLIDLGTNGEMAVTDGTHMIVTATAAGPAFEGGAGAGIIGSDMIACTAQLLQQRVMDESGLLTEPYFTEGVSVHVADKSQYPQYRFTPGRTGQTLYMTQGDIRSLQMAKAAVRAGVEVLLKQLEKQRMNAAQQNGMQMGTTQQNGEQTGVQQVERVYLAGGFGYYLDVEAAFCIGLLPEHMRGHVQAVGNTSLAGAYRIGRALWRREIDGQTLEQSLSSAESINLAAQEDFEELYIRYMNFAPVS